MKKMFFVIVAFLCATQIVKAQKKTDSTKVTTLDATLKLQGTQNEASTMAWLEDPTPDPTLINMPLSSFNKEFLRSLSQLNAKYGTFPIINSDVASDQIIPNLYTAELDLDKIYCFSRYDLATGKWGSWWRTPKKLPNGRIESGLFYKGWEEPILSVWCWNFGYPFKDKPTVPKVPKTETEIVILPGTNKYFYKTDTIRERNDVYKEVQNNVFLNTSNNNFAKASNQSYTVDMGQQGYQQTSGCNNCQVQQNTCNNCQPVQQCNSYQQQQTYTVNQQQYQPSCGCHDNYTCRKHRDHRPFFQSTGFKILSYVFAVGAGWYLNEIFDRDDPRARGLTGITQGPFNPVTTTGPGIFTQGPMFQ